MRGDLWTITCHFNPCHYGQRLRNYRVFRERMRVPLLAVELSYDGSYELAETDADRVIRLRGTDVLWQKERLLNVAIAALPAGCEAVAWLDGDVLFARDDWPQETLGLLDRYAMVQLFSRFTDLPRGVEQPRPADAAEPGGWSFAYLYAQGGHEAELFDAMWGNRESRTADGVRVERTRSSGLAWAAPRALLQRHGLYDACILGSGDRAIACAACGKHETSAQNFIRTGHQRRHYLQWARAFSRSVRGRVFYVGGDVFHLWHGDFHDRRYRERWRDFAPFGFDPAADIGIDEAGCWAWRTAKPAMHAYVARYFALRREDGDPSGAERAASDEVKQPETGLERKPGDC
jgi:hypothetical protein